ncbi:hypothetical protein KDA_65830 [Dictyobacter alpinus]|uniref:Uncharacterized protein n=1 Tax=Dictyobacter alpinus TaxID=2014873 RepID=A0A402BID1_9CHLR|nr:hypothetical protein KDA_65830 [Dictyobacter alpinus]
MLLSLRNKQVMALLVLVVLSLLVLTFIVLSLAHINMWQALNVKPNVFVPWF